MEFAARFRQGATIRWLLDRGADLDIASLWTMGFQSEAIAAAGNARWRDPQRAPEATTPLHNAVRLGDEELVRILLADGADLTLRDRQWQGRPLDWANALGHPDLATIFREAMRASSR